MSLELDRAHIERVLNAAAEQLRGDWVLVGGALAAIWFSPGRKTEDIDLLSMSDASADRLQLMELASGMGLPVEAVNSAADFFLRRIEGWRGELELLRAGPSCRIFRANPTLFLLLKIGRLSEDDLDDCLELLTMCRRQKLTVDNRRVKAALKAVKATTDRALVARRSTLRRALKEQ